MHDLDVDVAAAESSRRMFARTCVDWTHRRPHLAGALPAAITERLIARGWLTRTTGRALRATDDFDSLLDDWLRPE